MFSRWHIVPGTVILLLLIPFYMVHLSASKNGMDFVENENGEYEDVFRIAPKSAAAVVSSTGASLSFMRKASRKPAFQERIISSTNAIRRPMKRERKLTIRRNGWQDVTETPSIPTCEYVMAICAEEPLPQIPVCDNANRTHRSACSLALFSCEQMRLRHSHSRILVHIGPCNVQSPVFTFEEEICPSECSSKYKPVCDTIQQTYPNLCTFQKYNCLERKNNESNASYLYALMACNHSFATAPTMFQEKSAPQVRFECPKLGACAGLRQPMCDSDGRWHRNHCSFLWARCMAARHGRQLSLIDSQSCAQRNNRIRNRSREVDERHNLKGSPNRHRAARRCQRVCPVRLAYDPICANTFITYPNQCMFQNAKCIDKSLEQLFRGECRDCLTTACGTPADNEPDSNFVCDQAGRTKTKCEFEMLRCIYEKKFGYNITAAYAGRCCPSEDSCASSYDGISQSQPQQPVCDSANVTHPSRCHFEVCKCRAEKIAHRRIALSNENDSCRAAGHFGLAISTPQVVTTDQATKCNEAVECDAKYEPVCGTDGITYVNRCRLEKTRCYNKSLSIEYNGECCVTRCELHWAPVCDNRNVTHMNLCVFSLRSCIAARRAGQPLQIVSYTVCEGYTTGINCSLQCEPNDNQPVCASNGITYRNKCELTNVICELKRERRYVLSSQYTEQMELEFDYAGECCEDDSAKCNDTRGNSSPLCDSEGRSHANICEYERAACLSRKRFRTNLTIRYWGQCCPDECQNEPSGAAPVCDDTQTTHVSWCKFRLAQCESHRRNSRTLQMAYMGQCCKISRDDKCSNSGAVCDTDTVTHSDLCLFRHRQCVLSRTQHRPITIAYYGECCTPNTRCSNKWVPVCDQQGTMYRNRCHFDAQKCLLDRTTNITLVLAGCPRQLKRSENISNLTVNQQQSG